LFEIVAKVAIGVPAEPDQGNGEPEMKWWNAQDAWWDSLSDDDQVAHLALGNKPLTP
jgi:hypothetical protein